MRQRIPRSPVSLLVLAAFLFCAAPSYGQFNPIKEIQKRAPRAPRLPTKTPKIHNPFGPLKDSESVVLPVETGGHEDRLEFDDKTTIKYQVHRSTGAVRRLVYVNGKLRSTKKAITYAQFKRGSNGQPYYLYKGRKYKSDGQNKGISISSGEISGKRITEHSAKAQRSKSNSNPVQKQDRNETAEAVDAVVGIIGLIQQGEKARRAREQEEGVEAVAPPVREKRVRRAKPPRRERRR